MLLSGDYYHYDYRHTPTIVMMPFTFSIAEDIVFGILAYTLLRALTGCFRDISATMWALALLFLLRFFV